MLIKQIGFKEMQLCLSVNEKINLIRNQEIEVDDDKAKSLIASGNFEAVKLNKEVKANG